MEAEEKPQAYRTHPAILANLPSQPAADFFQTEKGGEEEVPCDDRHFELLLEEHLDAKDRIELAYHLNEYETNGCDLSELLSYLMQSLLIKLPNLMIKYKLLSYIKQLYVEPKLRAGERQVDNQQELPLDLRLFDATIRRYLLASHQPLLLSSKSTATTNSEPLESQSELQRKRRQRRAAELRNQLFSSRPIDYRSGSSSPATPIHKRLHHHHLQVNLNPNMNLGSVADANLEPRFAGVGRKDDRLLPMPKQPRAPDAADTCGLMDTKTSAGRPYQSRTHYSPQQPPTTSRHLPRASLEPLNQPAWPHAPGVERPYRWAYNADAYRNSRLYRANSSSSSNSAYQLGASPTRADCLEPLLLPSPPPMQPDDIDNELGYLQGNAVPSAVDELKHRYLAQTELTNMDAAAKFLEHNGPFKSREDHPNDHGPSITAADAADAAHLPLLSLQAAPTFAHHSRQQQHRNSQGNNNNTLNEFSPCPAAYPWRRLGTASLSLETLAALERLEPVETMETPPGGARGLQSHRVQTTVARDDDSHCVRLAQDKPAGAFFAAPPVLGRLEGLAKSFGGGQKRANRCCSVPCEPLSPLSLQFRHWPQCPGQSWRPNSPPRPLTPRPFDQAHQWPSRCWRQQQQLPSFRQLQHWQLAAGHNNYNQAHKKYGPPPPPQTTWAPCWASPFQGVGTSAGHLLASASLPSSPIANDKLGGHTLPPLQHRRRHYHHHHQHGHHHGHHHHHHSPMAQHSETSGQFWRPPTNQLKDHRRQRMGLVQRNRGESAEEDEYGQYDGHQVGHQDQTEEDDEEEEEVLLVPSQARGRLRMSVAEQMKEQASSFVQQYRRSSSKPFTTNTAGKQHKLSHNNNNNNNHHHHHHHNQQRQKPQLQVRRMLKVKIKKSKPILGIAIEGGFNVSGQLLPRIVCVHEEGAAYQCGKLRASDLILEVNGESTVNMTHDEIAKTIANAYYQDPRPHIEFLIGESVNVSTT